MKSYWVYILTNGSNKVLYVGVTSQLFMRLAKHKQGYYLNSFTKRYCVYKLVWFEEFSNVKDALDVEKKIQGWMRYKKIDLIDRLNPEWRALMS